MLRFRSRRIAAALVTPFLMGGWVFSSQVLRFDLSRLDPLQGLGRMFSTHGLVELVKASLKAVLVASVGVWVVWRERDHLFSLMLQPLEASMDDFASLVLLSTLLIVASLAGALVLYNTIRVAIYSRKQEIEVMLLVGAMPGFVSLPFMLLGVFWGFCGTLAASVVLGLLYKSLVASVQSTLPFIQLLDTPGLFMKLGGFMIGTGITMSWLCSWFAVERHISDAMKPS